MALTWVSGYSKRAPTRWCFVKWDLRLKENGLPKKEVLHLRKKNKNTYIYISPTCSKTARSGNSISNIKSKAAVLRRIKHFLHWLKVLSLNAKEHPRPLAYGPLFEREREKRQNYGISTNYDLRIMQIKVFQRRFNCSLCLEAEQNSFSSPRLWVSQSSALCLPSHTYFYG